MGIRPVQYFCRGIGAFGRCDARGRHVGASLSSSDNCLRRSVCATNTSGLGCSNVRIFCLYGRSCGAFQNAHDWRLHSVSFSRFDSDRNVVVGSASGRLTEIAVECVADGLVQDLFSV